MSAAHRVAAGMAYPQLANVNPIYGLYSGIVAVIVSSLSTGTILMMSTLTSAIALATGSVLSRANVQSDQLPQALFTITFLWDAATAWLAGQAGPQATL